MDWAKVNAIVSLSQMDPGKLGLSKEAVGELQAELHVDLAEYLERAPARKLACMLDRKLLEANRARTQADDRTMGVLQSDYENMRQRNATTGGRELPESFTELLGQLRDVDVAALGTSVGHLSEALDQLSHACRDGGFDKVKERDLVRSCLIVLSKK